MEGDAVLGKLFVQQSEWMVTVTWQHQVAVDFVGDDQHVVLHADFTQEQQLVLRPATANGVVGIAEDEHLGGLGLLNQLVEVEFIAISSVYQSVVHQLSAMARNGMMERRVNRWLDDDLVARLSKGQHSHVEAAHHARGERHPILVHIPMVMAQDPFSDGLKICLILEMVAIDGVLGATHDSLADEVWGFKIHVGHPHRQHVGVAKHLLAQVVFNAVGINAVDDLVEIVFHCRSV